MNIPLLSILIPTIVGRERELDALLASIKTQHELPHSGLFSYGTDSWPPAYSYSDMIEVIWYKDNKGMAIGQKRELLYKKASGLYSWQIDDDDNIADNAIELILEAIKQEPDCVTFQEYCKMDGKEYKSNHSLSYPDWMGDGNQVLSDGFHFWRTPFMKSVIKTEIARSVPVPHIRFGEDHQWAQALKTHLKTEVHIPEDIYFYQHASSNFNERYGYDRD